MMRVILFALVLSVSFAGEIAKENLRLKASNKALLKTLQSLNSAERSVGMYVSGDCSSNINEPDCLVKGCEWEDGVCQMPSSERAVGDCNLDNGYGECETCCRTNNPIDWAMCMVDYCGDVDKEAAVSERNPTYDPNVYCKTGYHAVNVPFSWTGGFACGQNCVGGTLTDYYCNCLCVSKANTEAEVGEERHDETAVGMTYMGDYTKYGANAVQGGSCRVCHELYQCRAGTFANAIYPPASDSEVRSSCGGKEAMGYVYAKCGRWKCKMACCLA